MESFVRNPNPIVTTHNKALDVMKNMLTWLVQFNFIKVFTYNKS